LRVEGPVVAREALKRAGAALVRPRHFEDNVLMDDASGSLTSSRKLLRLRRAPDGATLTFKGPRTVDGGIKSRTEIEAHVSDPDALEAILVSLGYQPVFRYQKYRETYVWGPVEVVVDETPVGTFLEIEGDPEGIRSAAGALGYGPADFISDSYASLFFASGGRGDMVFR
jgi:adenylate cyclase class 2